MESLLSEVSYQRNTQWIARISLLLCLYPTDHENDHWCFRWANVDLTTQTQIIKKTKKKKIHCLLHPFQVMMNRFVVCLYYEFSQLQYSLSVRLFFQSECKRKFSHWWSWLTIQMRNVKITLRNKLIFMESMISFLFASFVDHFLYWICDLEPFCLLLYYCI